MIEVILNGQKNCVNMKEQLRNIIFYKSPLNTVCLVPGSGVFDQDRLS